MVMAQASSAAVVAPTWAPELDNPEIFVEFSAPGSAEAPQEHQPLLPMIDNPRAEFGCDVFSYLGATLPANSAIAGRYAMLNPYRCLTLADTQASEPEVAPETVRAMGNGGPVPRSTRRTGRPLSGFGGFGGGSSSGGGSGETPQTAALQVAPFLMFGEDRETGLTAAGSAGEGAQDGGISGDDVAVVPLPASGLMLVGAFGLLALRRRFRN
jgi:hypothetical protein